MFVEIFWRTKIEKYFSRSRMFKKIVEKVNKNRKFRNFEKISKKIEILKFSIFIYFFNETFSEHFFISKNIFRFLFAKKFRRKNLDEKKSVHLFRFQISQRFQKSHLENCAMRPCPPSRPCVYFPPKFTQTSVDLA